MENTKIKILKGTRIYILKSLIFQSEPVHYEENKPKEIHIQ